VKKVFSEAEDTRTCWFSRVFIFFLFLIVFPKPGFTVFQSGFSFKSGSDLAWKIIKDQEFKNPVLRSITAYSDFQVSQSEKFSEVDYLFSCDPELFIIVTVSDSGAVFTAHEHLNADTTFSLTDDYIDSDVILKEISDSGYFNLLFPPEIIQSYEIKLSGYSPFFLPSNSPINKPVYQVKAKTGLDKSDPTGEIILLLDPANRNLISNVKTDYSLFSLKSRLQEVFDYAWGLYPECKLISMSTIDFFNSASDSLTMGRFVDGYYSFLSKDRNPFSIYLFRDNKPMLCGCEFFTESTIPEKNYLDSDEIAIIANRNGGVSFLNENDGASVNYLFGNMRVPGLQGERTCWRVKYQSPVLNRNFVIWIEATTGKVLYQGINVAVEKTPPPPGDFHVGDNYPNPFNGETNFTVTAPLPTHLIVSVFDISGREVSIPKNYYIQTRQTQINIDLGLLSSGVYFCRFEGAEKSMSGIPIQFRKIIIQK